MIGIDTHVFDADYQAKNPKYMLPNINAFSAYPLFYIKFVNEKHLLTLEEAVQKTSDDASKSP